VKKTTRKIVNRQGTTLCDICKKPNILHGHHIRGRDIPNANHQSNIANICPNCHMEVHYGIKIIEGWIMTSSGLQLFWHKKGEASFTGDDAMPNLLIPYKSE
jgi:hypothetical protein